MTVQPGAKAQAGPARERPSAHGAGWVNGDPHDYDREYCGDLAQHSAFRHVTQSETAKMLDLGQGRPAPRRFLT